ncbi:unnamed protein product [Mytilus edulis]|uniref:Uncharacterized protein n=1 Tax=Mytilus edulis TaxID=6550 RepID=A0A8S3QD26_MYTED|nr:unnamed protein product [Mytilus edulis]
MYRKWFTGTITVETENTFYQCMKVVHWYYNSRETEIPSTNVSVVHWYYNSRETRKYLLPMYVHWFYWYYNSKRQKIPSTNVRSGSTGFNSRETEIPSTNRRQKTLLPMCKKVVHWYYNSRETENTFYQCMKVVPGTITVRDRKYLLLNVWFHCRDRKYLLPTYEVVPGTITVERQKIPSAMYESGSIITYAGRETEIPSAMYEKVVPGTTYGRTQKIPSPPMKVVH